MKRDAVEKLAFTVAKQLRAALAHTVRANEEGHGYGTVSLTGHPIFDRLWLQCTGEPEQALHVGEKDVMCMPPIIGEQRLYGSPPQQVEYLPLILYRDGAAPIQAMLRLWTLDELRWRARRHAGDPPRTRMDTLLTRLNHGDMPVVIPLTNLVRVLKEVIR